MKPGCTLSILILTLCASCARSIELTPAAQQASQTALRLIDDKSYTQSWEQASTIFRDIVTLEAWLTRVASLRDPHGQFHERLQRSAVAMTDPADSPKGEWIVITYDSRFDKNIVVETLMMYLEDGRWRMAGYFLKVP